MRSAIRFIALLLLTFVGSVEGVRMATAPSIQACACGCGAPSDDLCGCKGLAQPSTPANNSKPCSEPSRGCSTTSNTITSLIPASRETEERKKDPEPSREPHPWALLHSRYQDVSTTSLLRLSFGTLGETPTPWRSLQRLAWLSVFRN
jgi:hypothetical protein